MVYANLGVFGHHVVRLSRVGFQVEEPVAEKVLRILGTATAAVFALAGRGAYDFRIQERVTLHPE